MSTGAIVAIVIAVAVVLLIVGLVVGARSRRRARLQERFGPEYDRTVEGADRRRDAERELASRAERRDNLDIQPLSPAAVTRYQQEWATVQQRFVDEPVAAVRDGHGLVTRVMAERGYPTDDRDERMSMLSVDHADVVDRYRSAAHVEAASHENSASTEDLRRAFRDYRTLFERLVSDGVDGSSGADGTASAYPTEQAAEEPSRTER